MDILDSIGDWMIAHEHGADITFVWGLFVGYALMAIVKTDTCQIMLRQRDRTRVGVALKRQYFAEIFKNAGQSALYGLIIWLNWVYPEEPFNVWDRMGLRGLVILSLWTALVFNLALNQALRGEVARTSVQDARDVTQDERGAAQDRRDAEWDTR